jgi:hypothetical protein
MAVNNQPMSPAYIASMLLGPAAAQAFTNRSKLQILNETIVHCNTQPTRLSNT